MNLNLGIQKQTIIILPEKRRIKKKIINDRCFINVVIKSLAVESTTVTVIAESYVYILLQTLVQNITCGFEQAGYTIAKARKLPASSVSVACLEHRCSNTEDNTLVSVRALNCNAHRSKIVSSAVENESSKCGYIVSNPLSRSQLNFCTPPQASGASVGIYSDDGDVKHDCLIGERIGIRKTQGQMIQEGL